MVRDEKLISYLPQYIQDYREIKQILNSEDPEILTLNVEIDQFKNNQFILSCNETGIKEFEDLLNISPSPDDTLEARISRVLARWNDSIPYTYKALVQKLMVLCGGLNFTINRNFNEYKMEIITHLELSGQVDELQYLLGYMIPVNLELTSKNDIYCNSEGEQNLAAGMAFCQTFELSDAFKADFNLQGAAIIGGGIFGSVEVTLSDNFNETLVVNGLGITGSNASITEITGIN